MADHQYPSSHHQSHHHHNQPPSPASSTDSRSNSSNDRNPFPRNSSSPVKPIIPPSHPTTQQQQNSNPDRQKAAGNTQGFNAPVGYHPPYDSSSSLSHYPPRLSPPPEHQAVAYPTAPPGQNTSWDYHPPYNHLQQRHLSPVHHPNPPSWNPNQPSPPLQSPNPPSAPQDDSNDQVDQLADDLTAVPRSTPGPPPVISPPESPPQGSITLTAPNLPYHPRIHYPISSPGSDQPSSRQYSFVSLPGNAMRKRPRRKFDEIERLYACNFPGCTKAYGTLNHLNAHVSMQRHGQKRTPGEFKDMRRARKQAQREQARAAAARDHHEEADGEDNGSPVAGPSTSPASSSRATKRKIRRATEPALHRIPSLDDATGGPNMPEEYGGRMAQASRQQQQLEISRRVSMDDYALQQAAGMMDRRGSGGSDEDTQGDDLADQPGPSSTQRILGASVTMPSGPMGGSTEQPLGLHGAHTTSPPALVSSGGQLPPMSMDSQGQSMQFWQQHQPPSSVAAQHQAPISPTTVVAPHVSHLPGPGPAVPPGMPLHASSSGGHHPRQPSWPPSGAYGAGSSSQQVGQSGGPPPLVPATSYSSHHSNPLPFPLQPSAQQTQSPPSHMQQQTHIQHAIGVPTPSPPRSAPQTQTQHFQAHSQQQYSASPPPAAAAAANSMHRLHQSSMLLTPLNVGGGGASHRQSYAQEPSGTQSNQPSAYGQTTIGGGGGAGSSSAQGLPSVFELESLSRDPAQEQQQQQQRGSIQQQQHAQQQSAPIVQQTQTTSWESYQQSSTYSAAPGPSHRDSYAAAAPPLGRSVGGYDPSREYYPPTSRPDMYGGQRNVVYGAAVPQSRPEAHPAAAYGHPQRSVSYSAPGSSDPYMVPGPSQSQRTDAQQPPPSSYIPARSESYSAVSSRGDPGAGYASAPGGGRSDPYGAAQQRQAPEQQQQYQTIPPPQSHIPHHPGLHPQHLPSSDPAHPDPRHDPYGRGHPGPSEGPY